MRKDFLVFFTAMLILCFIPGCLDNGGNGDDGIDEEGALEFGLKVVQTYFSNDMEEFKSYLDDEIYTLEGDGPMSKAEVVSFLNEKDYVASDEYLDHTYQEYLDTYQPYVMDKDQTNARFDGLADDMISLGWDFDEDDYIFMGFETKSGNEEDAFLWDDPLVFGVTHEDGKWAFKAFSG